MTAETAMALPLIAIFALSMAWLVTIGITEVRALDAARETARCSGPLGRRRGGDLARTPRRTRRVADQREPRRTAPWSPG